MRLVRVAVPVPLGQAFTYEVPEALSGDVRAGSRVLVPFGRRKILGVVLRDDADSDVPKDKLKALHAVVDAEPVLPSELLEFLLELARYYLAPIGEVMRLALPAVERSAAERLDQQGLLEGTKLTAVGRLVQVASRTENSTSEASLRGQAQEVLAHLEAHGPTPVAELTARWGNARSAVKRLEAEGLVKVEQVEQSRDRFFAGEVARDEPPELNPAQRAALDSIVARLQGQQRGAFLLHGVTGSGKTEVYLRAVQRCLEQQRGAIVLVPEIALTPQLVGRFRARVGNEIAVLHSGLGDRDRHVMWKRLRQGDVRVAVGARSALFAPVPDLGLICVDEEHDGSFKQEEGVRYHARDMALLRAHRAGAVCVLGSATPSLSSHALTRAGRLELLELPERAHHQAVLPKVEIVDLRRVGPGPAGDRLLSLPLHRELERVVAAQEQAILFLNRRGFAPSLVCEACGHIAECPHCSVALTTHRTRGAVLQCHYCDYHVPSPRHCGACKSDRLVEEGAGTERIEALLAKSLPDARIARLDRDVAGGLKSEQVLQRVRNHEVDILVGTQMVTKGHDLPQVTLVGVLNADAALGMPDFRAAERTFQLLVQVAGRAGRGDLPGTVMIQTRQPDHPAVRAAARHDVAAFVEQELADRRELGYPPYSRMAMVRIDARDEGVARNAAEQLRRIAEQSAGPGAGELRVIGPAPAPLARLRNRFRFQFALRAEQRKQLRGPLLAVLRRSGADRRVRVAVDVDPESML